MTGIRAFEVSISIDDDRTELNDQADRCMDHAERALSLFLRKQEGYGDTSFLFGKRGQVQDMYRKVMKLKRVLWDGVPDPAGEKPEEVVMDLIGHCLLTLDFLRTDEGHGQNGSTTAR